MERIIRIACFLTVVLFMAIMVGSVANQGVYAGGGKDGEGSTEYKVAIRNDTEYQCSYHLFVDKPGGYWDGRMDAIFTGVPQSPGTTLTLNAGKQCPMGLEGQMRVKVPGAYRIVQFFTDINGQPASNYTSFTEKSCSGSSWRVIHQGNDKFTGYTFVKN